MQTNGMVDITPTALASVATISLPYASQILSGTRQPARSLAIHIFRKTGWKHAILDGLSDEQIDLLETVEPWTPTGQRAA